VLPTRAAIDASVLPDVGTGGTSEFGRSVNFCASPEKGLYFGYLHTTAAGAIAEGLGEAIAACAIPGDREGKTLTVSIGVATFPDHADDAEGLFRAADAAMYAVKRSTKNGVATGKRASEGR